MKKKMTAILLILCMTVGFIPAVALADDEKPVYVVLGDSIAAAYGTDEYTEYVGERLLDDTVLPSSSYASIIAEKRGFDVITHAHSGWRTTEFLRMIGEHPEEGDEISTYMLTGLGWLDYDSAIASEADAIPEDLAKADVITVCFGSNDIFSYALHSVFSDPAVVEKLENMTFPGLETDADTVATLVKVIEILGVLRDFENYCNEGSESYKHNLPLVLEYLEKTAPNAKIYMQSLENPVKINNDEAEGAALEIPTFIDRLAADANSFLMEQCAQYDDAYFVNVSGTEFYGINPKDLEDITITEEDYADAIPLLKSVHPTEKGHAHIAEKFMAAMDRTEMKPEIKVDTNFLDIVRVSWNSVKGARAYQIYRADSTDGEYKLVGTSLTNSWTDIGATSKTGTYSYKVSASTDLNGLERTSYSDPVKHDVLYVGIGAGIVTEIFHFIYERLTIPLRIVNSIMNTASNIIGKTVKI